MIAQTTGHKSMTVLRRYIREGDMFREKRGGGRVVGLLLLIAHPELGLRPTRHPEVRLDR